MNKNKIRNSDFVNLQFEVVGNNNIEKGDFFIDGDTIHCFDRGNDSIVIDKEGLWHNPKSIKKVLGSKLIK